jgi:hypothetical protein
MRRIGQHRTQQDDHLGLETAERRNQRAAESLPVQIGLGPDTSSTIALGQVSPRTDADGHTTSRPSSVSTTRGRTI